MAYVRDGARTYEKKYTPKSTTESYEEARGEKTALKNNKTPQQVKTNREEKSKTAVIAKKQAEKDTLSENGSNTAKKRSCTEKSAAKAAVEDTPVPEEVKEQIRSTIKAAQDARDEQTALKSKAKNVTPGTVKQAREDKSTKVLLKKYFENTAEKEKVNTQSYKGYEEGVKKTLKAVPSPESTALAYKEKSENKFGRTFETNTYKETKPDVPKYPLIDTDKTQSYNQTEKSYQGLSTLKNAYTPADVRLMRSYLIEQLGKDGMSSASNSGMMDDTLFRDVLKLGVAKGTVTESIARVLANQGKDKSGVNLWDIMQIPQSRAEWLYDSSRTGTMEDILDSKIKNLQNDYSKSTTASAQNALIRYAKDQKGELSAEEENMLYNIVPYAASGSSIPGKYVTGSVKMSIIPLESEQAREAFADVFVDAMGSLYPTLGVLGGLSKIKRNQNEGIIGLLTSFGEKVTDTVSSLAENELKRKQKPNVSYTDSWELEEKAANLFPDGMRQLDEFTKAVDVVKAPLTVVDIAEVIDGVSDLHWNNYDSGYIVKIQVSNKSKKTYLCDSKGNIISDISSEYKASDNEYLSEFGKKTTEVNISYPALNRTGETDTKTQKQAAMK